MATRVCRIRRRGNRLVLLIPKSLAAKVGLEENSPVDLSVHEGKLIVAPAGESDRTLNVLLAKVTSRNRHEEVKIGCVKGKEAW